MLKPHAVLAIGLAAAIGAPHALADSACAWKATRKRNDLDAVCYHTLGPVSETWSVAPGPQAKLEKCLLGVWDRYRLERAQCDEMDRMSQSKKP